MSGTTPYTTPDATPKHTRSETSRLNKNFINETKNDKRKINTKVFNEYFWYQNHFFLTKDLLKANQVKNIK